MKIIFKNNFLFFFIILLLPFFAEAKVYDSGPIDADQFWATSYFSAGGGNYCVCYDNNLKDYVKTSQGLFGPYGFAPYCAATDSQIIFYYRDPDNYNSYYVNINGTDHGPYEGLDKVKTEGDNLMFTYETGRKVFVNGKEYGPYSGISSFDVSENLWGFSYSSRENQSDSEVKYYINLNGTIYGPYSQTGDIGIYKNNWVFEFMKNGKRYLNIKGQEVEKLSSTRVSLGEEGWALTYQDSGSKKYYVNVNGTIKGPYESVADLNMISNNRWGYAYSDGLNKYKIVVDGKEYGPYDMYTYNFYIAKDHWAVKTNKAQESTKVSNYYLYIDGEYIGGFNNIDLPVSSPIWSENKRFIIQVIDYQNYYFFDGQNKIGPYASVGEFYTYTNGWAFTYKQDGKMHLKYVDGAYDGSDKQAIFDADIPADASEQIQITDINLKKDAVNGTFTITWKTNVDTKGRVDYELMPGNIRSGLIKTQNEFLSGYKKEHKAEIWGASLIDGLFYRPIAEDKNGNVKQIAYITYLRDSSGNSGQSTQQQISQNIKINSGANSNKNGAAINIKNSSQYNRLKGRIMLKVQDSGKAYYINPADQKMYYLGRPDDAFSVMRGQGVGITNANLEKIPIGLQNSAGTDTDKDGLSDMLENAMGTNKNNKDTDGDGIDDKTEVINSYSPKEMNRKMIFDSKMANGNKGKIFLQVESKGEAWYVNPADGKRYFLGRPGDAFNVMRSLGLGINDNDFSNL